MESSPPSAVVRLFRARRNKLGERLRTSTNDKEDPNISCEYERLDQLLRKATPERKAAKAQDHKRKHAEQGQASDVIMEDTASGAASTTTAKLAKKRKNSEDMSVGGAEH